MNVRSDELHSHADFQLQQRDGFRFSGKLAAKRQTANAGDSDQKSFELRCTCQNRQIHMIARTKGTYLRSQVDIVNAFLKSHCFDILELDDVWHVDSFRPLRRGLDFDGRTTD